MADESHDGSIVVLTSETKIVNWFKSCLIWACIFSISGGGMTIDFGFSNACGIEVDAVGTVGCGGVGFGHGDFTQ